MWKCLSAGDCMYLCDKKVMGRYSSDDMGEKMRAGRGQMWWMYRPKIGQSSPHEGTSDSRQLERFTYICPFISTFLNAASIAAVNMSLAGGQLNLTPVGVPLSSFFSIR